MRIKKITINTRTYICVCTYGYYLIRKHIHHELEIGTALGDNTMTNTES